MEEIAGVVGNWLSRLKFKQHLAQLTLEIFEAVKSLKEHDLTHANLHINNIGYVYTDSSKKHMKLMPIDFGRFYVAKAHTTKLARSCASIRNKSKQDNESPVPDYNGRVLMNLIRKFARQMFQITLRKSLNEVSKRYLAQLERYRNEFGVW